MDAPKKGFLLALGAPKASKDDDDDDEGPPSSSKGGGGDEDAMMKSAMRDFLDAVKSDDEDAAVDAFKDLCELHKEAGGGDY